MYVKSCELVLFLGRRLRPARLRCERESVATRREHKPVMTGEHLLQDFIMTLKSSLHLGRMVFPQSSRPLDIGEQERHRPRRSLGHGTQHLTPPGNAVRTNLQNEKGPIPLCRE